MFKISRESIQFQNKDSFVDQACTIISDIYKGIENHTYKSNLAIIKSEHIKSLEKLIQSRFNMFFIFDGVMSEHYPAAVMPFLSDKLLESGLLDQIKSYKITDLFSGFSLLKKFAALDKERELYLSRINKRKGFVDLKYARVGGYLSDVKSYLAFNFFFMHDLKLSEREVVAILLHEIGHGFMGLITHHRLSTTNAIILDALTSVNKNDVDKQYFIFKRHFKQEDLDKAGMTGQETIEDFYGKAAALYIQQLPSQFGSSKYDETHYETIADGFVVRFNLGQEIVTGLEKMHRAYGATMDKNGALYWTVVTIDVMIHAILLATVFPFGAMISLFLLWNIFGNSNTTMTYDFPLERYTRIKHGIVQNLKDTSLPKDLTQNLVNQYETITEIIESTDYFKGVGNIVADFVFPTNRNNANLIQQHQQVEDSLNNALFVKSAQLRSV